MVSAEFKLDGKKALVAGDSRFWAKPVAAALAEAGADVAIVAKNPKKLEAAAAGIRRFGKKAVSINADVTKSSQVENMVQTAISQLGRIDILVNTSDLQVARPFLDTTKTEWQRVLDANLTSLVLTCQAVGRHMLQQKKGRIINITSCLAERGIMNGTAYCAAAGGVVQLTRALSLEWAKQGITVNSIGAGWFSEKPQTGAPQEDSLIKYLPMKRYGRPEEIGSLVVYLASDATDFVTGQFMYADGALMAHP